MLEKIGTAGFETLSQSDPAVIARLAAILEREPEPTVFEVGVGIGATSIEIAKRLAGKGMLHIFSRMSDVKELADDLKAMGYDNVAQWGSPNRVYSGYHFEMADGFVTGRLPKFDLAYLDGGHVMHLDGTAICILKELAKEGAFLILDDVSWSLEQSPTMCPEVRPQTAVEYDSAQIAACHVDLARRCFLETDPRFELLEISRNTAVYRRLPDAALRRMSDGAEHKAQKAQPATSPGAAAAPQGSGARKAAKPARPAERQGAGAEAPVAAKRAEPQETA